MITKSQESRCKASVCSCPCHSRSPRVSLCQLQQPWCDGVMSLSLFHSSSHPSGGGRRSLFVFMDTIEGPRAPAVKLTAHHSSLTRVRAAPAAAPGARPEQLSFKLKASCGWHPGHPSDGKRSESKESRTVAAAVAARLSGISCPSKAKGGKDRPELSFP